MDFQPPPRVSSRRPWRGGLSPEDANDNARRPTILQATLLDPSMFLSPKLSPDGHQNSLLIDSFDPTSAQHYAFSPSQLSPTFTALPPQSRILRRKVPIDFNKLPQSVFECILDQLFLLHSDKLSPSCHTCYMRDLTALQLTSTAWDQWARNRLYSSIVIMGIDSPSQLKQYKMQRGSRLRLLRRTLRERRLLARLVKELEVPDLGLAPYLQNGSPNPAFREYRDLVASVVMICPRLERLTGFYSVYKHGFDRLTHALSTRQRLKEHVWIIGENEEVTARSRTQHGPGLLDRHQIYQFQQYHRNWTDLESLMICAPGQAGVIEHDLLVKVFQNLPSLERLCISSLDDDDFTDRTLLALPVLKSLRIEECPGITDAGLTRWAAAPAAERLQNLSLIHQNIVDLLTISQMFASLPRLTKFTIIQTDVVPAIPLGSTVFQPVLASFSLQKLHWEVAADPGEFDEKVVPPVMPPKKITSRADAIRDRLFGHTNVKLSPNSHLAMSIVHAGFPNLRSLRAPQDTSPPGALQAVCRPARNASVLLPADKYSALGKARGLMASLAGSETLPKGNSLHAARIRAQSYIDHRIKAPTEFVKFVVTDHSDPDLVEDSASSSNYSGSTEMTDPGDLSPLEMKLSELELAAVRPHSAARPYGADAGGPMSPERYITPGFSQEEFRAYTPQVFRPLRRGGHPPSIQSSAASTLSGGGSQYTQQSPYKVHEYSFPAFMGRVAATSEENGARPPRFELLPDLPGNDGNGGVVGWGDLLHVSERAAAAAAAALEGNSSGTQAWIKDGCTGAWNKSTVEGSGAGGAAAGKGPEWWRHTERERRKLGTVVMLDHLF